MLAGSKQVICVADICLLKVSSESYTWSQTLGLDEDAQPVSHTVAALEPPANHRYVLRGLCFDFQLPGQRNSMEHKGRKRNAPLTHQGVLRVHQDESRSKLV